jgi:hypothetical protein
MPPTKLAQLPVVLRPSLLKLILLLFFCVLVTALGVFIAHEGQFVGYFLAIFFGLGCGVFVLNMRPGAAYLRLETDGFTCRSLFRSFTVRWQDCERFGALSMRGNTMVAWKYVAGFQGKSMLRAVNAALFDYDASLPDNYGVEAQVLADAMQKLRDEAVAAPKASRFGSAEHCDSEA